MGNSNEGRDRPEDSGSADGVRPDGGRPRRTLTRNDLANAICDVQPELSRRQAGKLIDELLDEIVTALTAGETVRLHKFGNFKVSERRQRASKNPHTGGASQIAARKVLRFRPSDYLLGLAARNHTSRDDDGQP